MPKTNGANNNQTTSKTTSTKKKSDSTLATPTTTTAAASSKTTQKLPASASSSTDAATSATPNALATRPDASSPSRSRSGPSSGRSSEGSDGTSGKDASPKEQLRSIADMGRERVASEARGVVSTLERVAEAFDEGDQAWAGRYITTAGDKLDELARTIDEADTEQLVEETRRYARREPWLFLGGCFVLGLAAGRVLRAGVGSPDSHPSSQSQRSRSPRLSESRSSESRSSESRSSESRRSSEAYQ